MSRVHCFQKLLLISLCHSCCAWLLLAGEEATYAFGEGFVALNSCSGSCTRSTRASYSMFSSMTVVLVRAILLAMTAAYPIAACAIGWFQLTGSNIYS